MASTSLSTSSVGLKSCYGRMCCLIINATCNLSSNENGMHFLYASDFQSLCNCINSDGTFEWNAHVVPHRLGLAKGTIAIRI